MMAGRMIVNWKTERRIAAVLLALTGSIIACSGVTFSKASMVLFGMVLVAIAIAAAELSVALAAAVLLPPIFFILAALLYKAAGGS